MMKVLYLGLRAVWNTDENRSPRSFDVNFSVDRAMAQVMVGMQNSNEAFYAVLGSQRVPVVVHEVFIPGPVAGQETRPWVRLRSVGSPEPYLKPRSLYPLPTEATFVRAYAPLLYPAYGYLSQLEEVVTRDRMQYMKDNVFPITTTQKEMPLDNKTLKANRFYVGSDRALRTGWGKPTLAEAVEHAKQLLASTGQDQIVVQIVRVVRKKEQPVIVETVK